MTSVYLREQKRYTREELSNSFCKTMSETIRLIKRLKEYGILKIVKKDARQQELSDLLDEDIEVGSADDQEDKFYYVFPFVGVITVEDVVLKCLPKYLVSENNVQNHLKTVLKVLNKYNAEEQIIYMHNGEGEDKTFNELAIFLYLLNDYCENGSYSNDKIIIETNGSGEVFWDKTINETFAIISDNRPFYPELLSKKRVEDGTDFIKRLHECIVSRCSDELKQLDILELFDISEVDISDESLEDLGDKGYLLERILMEINTQFNTRKQILLKAMFVYIDQGKAEEDFASISMFGTNSFDRVWETVCRDVVTNQLQTPIKDLILPMPLSNEYHSRKHMKLIELIDKPIWEGIRDDRSCFSKEADSTLIPDCVSIEKVEDEWQFIITDAKYYNIQLEEKKKLRNCPGVSDVTKQYFYQLAFNKFVKLHKFNKIRNCFLMPTEEEKVVVKGQVFIEMMRDLGLEDIQIRLLPVEKMYLYYLAGKKLPISELNL